MTLKSIDSLSLKPSILMACHILNCFFIGFPFHNLYATEDLVGVLTFQVVSQHLLCFIIWVPDILSILVDSQNSYWEFLNDLLPSFLFNDMIMLLDNLSFPLLLNLKYKNTKSNYQQTNCDPCCCDIIGHVNPHILEINKPIDHC